MSTKVKRKLQNRILRKAIELQSTTAMGARTGIVKHTEPEPKRKHEKSDKTREDKDKRAAYMREYRARQTEEQRESARQRRREREYAQRHGKKYVYLPSIRQAKDLRDKGDKIMDNYHKITSLLAVHESYLVNLAHDDLERELDVLIQSGRRPTGKPWEFRPRANTNVPTLLDGDPALPTPRVNGGYLRPLVIQPYGDVQLTKEYPMTLWSSVLFVVRWIQGLA